MRPKKEQTLSEPYNVRITKKTAQRIESIIKKTSLQKGTYFRLMIEKYVKEHGLPTFQEVR